LAKKAVYGQEAERLYVRKGKTLEEISRLLHVSVRTLSLWKNRDNWSGKRKAFLTSPHGSAEALRDILEQKIHELQSLAPGEIDGKAIDGISKVVAAITKIERQADPLAEAINVLDSFTAFVRERESETKFLDRLYQWVHDFFEKLANER